MDVALRERGVFAFGGFRLDPVRRTLTCRGQEVALTARLFDTLLYIVQNPERLLTRDELESAIWGGRVVDESNLKQAISSLRKALLAAGAAENLIVTVAGRGYRFAVPVSFEPESFAGTECVGLPVSPRAARSRPAWPAAGLGAAALAAAFGLVWHFVGRPAFAPPPHSVAVMAFTNLSGDPAQEYVSDGLSEELIGVLGSVSGLTVAARTSAFSFKGKPATIPQIARALNVAAVLEGSVRKDASRLRIAVRLIDAVSGFALWTRDYDHAALEDPLRVETDIAAAVAAAIRADLPAGAVDKAAAGGTHNDSAFDAYVAGTNALQALDAAHDRAAIAHFSKAIGFDPAYALAYAGLAAAELSLVMLDEAGDATATQRLLVQARADVDRAIALQPGLAEAHRVKANVLETALDLRGAAAEITRARDLASGNARVLTAYAFIQADIGHDEEAIAAAREAVSLDPLSAGTFRKLGNVYWYTGHYTEAIATLRHADSIDPHPSPTKNLALAEAYLANGQPEAALPLCEPIDFWDAHVCLAIAYHALGRTAEAERQLQLVHNAMGDGGAFMYAQIHAQWGEPQAALHWLDVAYRLHDSGLDELRSSPYLAPIRGTAGFKDIERRLDFPS